MNNTNEYENWNDAGNQLYGYIAFVTAELKDYGIPNEDVYTIWEEFLDIVIDHREHWESTTHKMFEAVKKDIGTGGIKEFIAELRKWTIRIDYDDED